MAVFFAALADKGMRWRRRRRLRHQRLTNARTGPEGLAQMRKKASNCAPSSLSADAAGFRLSFQPRFPSPAVSASSLRDGSLSEGERGASLRNWVVSRLMASSMGVALISH